MSALGGLFFWALDLIVMVVHALIMLAAAMLQPLVSLWFWLIGARDDDAA